MRIIAGSAKGKVLRAKVPAGTRPVTDRAREGLFSSLATAVEGAAVLDLFAGSGALGIEALSRGAASATFVESDARAVKAIRENLQTTGFDEGVRVVRRRVEVFLAGLATAATLVFVDPPYAIPRAELERALSLLGMSGWLETPGWIVALTRPAKASPPAVPADWALAKTLRYGDTHIALYRGA